MRLKVFHAPKIGAAMAMVRDELGPDALILASRTVEGGVEVTAAREEAEPEPAIALAATSSAVPPPPVLTAEIARAGTLRWHGVPADLAARLGRGDLAAAVEAQFRFATLPCQPAQPPLLFVGPPGAGKTLSVARLATRLKLRGQTAMVITCDSRRAGAAEQLAAFTRLLGLPLIVAETPRQLQQAVARRVADEPVLIDMPGLNPSDQEDADFVRERQLAVGASSSLVLPAGLDPADAEDLATGFKDLGATMLMATRLDQSRRLGGLLAAADQGLALTEAGVSAAVAAGLTEITPAFLADRLSYTRCATPIGQPSRPTPLSSLALLARTRSEQPGSEL